MSNLSWFVQNYNFLKERFAGKWIILSGDKVVFADINFDLVYKKYQELRADPQYEIILVDNGDATFY